MIPKELGTFALVLPIDIAVAVSMAYTRGEIEAQRLYKLSQPKADHAALKAANDRITAAAEELGAALSAASLLGTQAYKALGLDRVAPAPAGERRVH